MDEKRIASENIRRARTKARQSRMQVAVRAGVDVSTVFIVEKGRGGFDARFRIGRALGLSPNEIFKKGKR
jgi:transcriptional regulator with XRE-family HTH domain